MVRTASTIVSAPTATTAEYAKSTHVLPDLPKAKPRAPVATVTHGARAVGRASARESDGPVPAQPGGGSAAPPVTRQPSPAAAGRGKAERRGRSRRCACVYARAQGVFVCSVLCRAVLCCAVLRRVAGIGGPRQSGPLGSRGSRTMSFCRSSRPSGATSSSPVYRRPLALRAACAVQHATCNLQRATYNVKHGGEFLDCVPPFTVKRSM
jgi:hypothetical protein